MFHRQLGAMPAELFQFDSRMATGWFSDWYFPLTAETVADALGDPIARMQVFAKKDGVLAGVYEVVRLLETQLAAHPATGRGHSLHDFRIETLMDGDPIRPREPVMHIVGPYLAFAHLETVYLGMLARRTLVASNVRRVIEAANGKRVIAMGARHDDPRVQTPDGWAARIGGIHGVSSHANGAWWGASGVGTMPHAMIACFNGDVVAATRSLIRTCHARHPDVNVVSLVDYANDVIGDSLRVATAMTEEFGRGALWGVRVDTSEMMTDRSLQGRETEFPGQRLNGVCAPLVRELRAALDAAGFPEIRIGVSGGFTPAKIHSFEAAGVPVDFYGVGSSLLGHNNGEVDGLLNAFDFTADIVAIDGRAESKAGRERRDNDRFITVDVPTVLAGGHR
ncbi:MAG: quinolinate phosphoribosyl transferase [Gemmatimonadaceae bacterium]